jgi:AraC-like DNA-binding protein
MVSFFFVEKNSCWVMVNGRKLTLNRGDLLVTSGADEFSYGHDSNNPQTSLTASLAVEQGNVANTLLHRRFQRCYTLPNPDEFSEEFDKVMTALSCNSHYRDFVISGAVLRWLAYVMPQLGAPLDHNAGSNRSAVDRILKAETWATSHLNQTVTLTDWSNASGMNKVYFERVFKRVTGQRPMEWLNQRRLELACQYLCNTNKSVSEIASDCGYTNQFYFSRIFRRKIGQPPSLYRKVNTAQAA